MRDLFVNHKIGCTLAFVSAMLLYTAPALFALEVPQLKGRVNDYAGMLSPYTERQLDDTLHRLEQTDSTQIVVLTIPSLQGENLEAFSIRIAEQWKIGQKGFDNGAIFLIAKKERKIRIEVGSGLEASLTDLVSGQIIRNVIAPRFRAGNIDQGVIEGVQVMVKVVRGEYTATTKTEPHKGRRTGWHPGIVSLIVFLFLINMLGRLRRSLGAAAGGLMFPIMGAMFFNIGLLWILALIPLGIVGGLIISVFGSPLSFGHIQTSSGHSGRGWFGGGGFSSGGFGGFSGGGGGFGGGGASGGW